MTNFGKLWEARSRLYRSRILQVNTRLKALDEIHKIYQDLMFEIYTLLHRSEFKNSAKIVVKHFRIFAVLFSKTCIFFNRSTLSLTKIHQLIIFMKKVRDFSNFVQKSEVQESFTEKIKYPIDSRMSWDFATKIVEFFRKLLSKS